MWTGQKNDMKKILFTLLIAFTAVSYAAAIRPGRIQTLVSEYRGTEGFDVLRVGPIGMGFLKLAVHASAGLDKEALAVLSSVRGLKGITIVDFEDAEYKEAFTVKLENMIVKGAGNGDTVVDEKKLF